MSAARPVKITGPLTRVMKRNNGDSKVNIISPPFFPPDLHVLPFASPTLRNAVKETSSGITAGRCIQDSVFFFFFPVWRLPAHVQ